MSLGVAILFHPLFASCGWVWVEKFHFIFIVSYTSDSKIYFHLPLMTLYWYLSAGTGKIVMLYTMTVFFIHCLPVAGEFGCSNFISPIVRQLWVSLGVEISFDFHCVIYIWLQYLFPFAIDDTVRILIGRNWENCDVVHVGLTKSGTIITTLGNKCLLWTESAGDKKFKFSMALDRLWKCSQIPSWTFINKHC